MGEGRAGDARHQEPAIVQGLASAARRGRGAAQLRRRNAGRICARRAGGQNPRLPRRRPRRADRQDRQPAMGSALPRSGDARMSDYNTVLVEKRGAVTLVTLNRPQALNALNSEVLSELIEVFANYDGDESQRCLVLTGSGEKAFAAGADIKEMQPQGFADMYSSDFFGGWEKVTSTRKPWIA